MSEQANEQIPGQGTLDDDATSATEIPVMPDRFLPEADALDERDDKKADEGGEPADTSNTPDPTVGSAPNADTTPTSSRADSAEPAAGSSTDTPDEHRYRIVVQTHNAGNDQPHSMSTTAAMDIKDAVRWLATRLPEGVKLAELLESVL